MSYTLDPELVPILASLAQQAAGAPARERGDWKALREAGHAGQAYMASLVPPVAGIKTATYFATAPDGASIELRWYTTGGAPQPGAAVVYAHGGGMVLGSLDTYDTLLSRYVARSGVPFLSIGYRLAPQATGTMLAALIHTTLGGVRDQGCHLPTVKAGVQKLRGQRRTERKY